MTFRNYIALKKQYEKELKENAEKYRLLYSSMSQGVALHEIILDENNVPVDYRFIDINNSFEKITGLNAKDIVGKTVLEILPDTEDYWIREYGEVALTGEPKHFDKYSADFNKYFDVYAYCPKPLQFAVLVTDITERRLKERELNCRYEELSAVYEELTATEEELRDNYKQLESAMNEVEKTNLAKSKLLANIGHEIKAPLNSILSMSSLLSLTKLTDTQLECLRVLNSSCNILLDTVNSISDVSKIESGKLKLKMTAFNLKENLDKIIKEISFICERKELSFSYYIDPLTQFNLIGDESKLNQILINLMSNALKFTDKGEIIFKVKNLRQTNEKVYLEFSIQDTGVGIDESVKENIFNGLRRSNFLHEEKDSNAGLGLPISKELVKMMNGDIGFESIPGEGSIFYFTAEFMLDFNYDNKIKESKKAPFLKDLINKKTVLIVEDNEINMRIFSGFLLDLGFNFVPAYDGNQALDLLKNNQVDLILMDVQLPNLNGYETTRIIRKNELSTLSHIPIIAMTSYQMIGDREMCIEYGMDEYISKPLEFNKLKNIIAKFI